MCSYSKISQHFIGPEGSLPCSQEPSSPNPYESSNASCRNIIPVTAFVLPQALAILERWRQDKGSDGDYVAAREALLLSSGLGLEGRIYFVNKHPAGYCLGEYVAGVSMFALHFEKCVDEYKGIYQAVNQFFASSLPPSCLYVNREQDLGDEGLRQSKMTYRPCGFVKKHIGVPHDPEPQPGV